MTGTVTEIHLAQAAVHRLPDGRTMGPYWVRPDSARFILSGSPAWQGTLDITTTPLLHDGLVLTFLRTEQASAGRTVAVFTIQPELAARLSGVV